VMQVRSSTQSSHTAKQIMATVDWMRLVQSLFEDIFGLALKTYVIILVRQRDDMRMISCVVSAFSASINVALMFGENQPCAPITDPEAFSSLLSTRTSGSRHAVHNCLSDSM
jgi:hypothetical protein